VGYGDLYPISNIERMVTILIQLGGVAFFSYIMGNFIDIMGNYDKKMGNIDKSSDLDEWLILLTRYTNNQPLHPLLVSEIEAHFSYYWSQDRLKCFTSDEKYLEALPDKIQD